MRWMGQREFRRNRDLAAFYRGDTGATPYEQASPFYRIIG